MHLPEPPASNAPSGASQPIRFYRRGGIVEVDSVAPTRSILDWLREDTRSTGTKEGCNEGDCGACTVVIAELAADGENDSVGGLRLRTVNSCIQFLPTLHGKALFTVEDLKGQCVGDVGSVGHRENNVAAALHPVQQAMVECHGSQCGFCTPGFVMSMWATYEHCQEVGSRPTRQQMADELSGNLCRCTGYRPILDAGQYMFDLPAVRLDTQPIVQALRALRRDERFTYQPQAHAGAHRFHAPVTLDDLAALRESLPKAQILAGSTDVGLWVNKQFRALGDILYVGDVEEMKTIEEQEAPGEGRELYIGAGAPLEAAWRALDARFEGLTDVWLRFASPPIRNAGTLGGNVANGSPIGDSPPILMALDAQIELRRGARVRRMPLSAFYLDYMKNQMEPGEFVQALAIPLTVRARQVRAYKISKRFDCDISALCAGFSIALEGEVVREVRLAFGGMAATVRRATQTEAALTGHRWDHTSVARAQATLPEDFKPLSDMRASAAYRLKVAQNLLHKLWLETRPHHALGVDATSVWSVMPHARHAVGA